MRDCADEKLAAALHDVSVPAGLTQRLLERLAAEPVEQGQGLSAENDASVAVAVPSSLAPRWSRRRFLAGSGLLAVAAALLCAVWLGLPRKDALSEALVLDEAIRSFDAEADPAGQLLAKQPAPVTYPFSFTVLPVRGVRWRPLTGGVFSGHGGIVYHLPGPAGAHGILYVVDAGPSKGFSALPARHPFTTGGCCASAWQENGLLYVLVVQGDPATYRAFLNLPHGPVA